MIVKLSEASIHAEGFYKLQCGEKNSSSVVLQLKEKINFRFSG